jgi:hypothetical protein
MKRKERSLHSKAHNHHGAELGGLFRLVSNCNGWVKSGSDSTLSHSLFSGGSFCVPDSHAAAFLEQYATDISASVKHYVNEFRTQLFPLYFDIDYVSAEPLTQDHVLTFASICQNAISLFYPCLPSPIMVVCVAPTKVKTEGTKSGIHVHFPQVIVDTTEALFMRAALLASLNSDKKDLPTPLNGWEDVVDEQVLMYNVRRGLRLIGSLKLDTCGCKGEATDPPCATCFGTGRIVQNRPYTVSMVLGEDQRVHESFTAMLKNDFAKAVHWCSIRKPNATKLEGFERPASCPSFVEPVLTKSGYEPGKVKVAARKSTMCLRVTDDDKLGIIYALVRERFKVRQYAELSFREVQYHTEKKEYYVYPQRYSFGCNYCLNKEDNHTSATVFFVVSVHGVCQRCTSSRVVVRKNGYICKKWSSHSKELTPSHRRVLFPGVSVQPGSFKRTRK